MNVGSGRAGWEQRESARQGQRHHYGPRSFPERPATRHPIDLLAGLSTVVTIGPGDGSLEVAGTLGWEQLGGPGLGEAIKIMSRRLGVVWVLAIGVAAARRTGGGGGVGAGVTRWATRTLLGSTCIDCLTAPSAADQDMMERLLDGRLDTAS